MKGLESEYPRNAFRVAMANKGTLAGTILSPTEIVPWLSLANEKIPEWVGALCLVTGHLGIILIVVTFGGMQTVASYERIIDSYKKTKRSPIHFGKRNQHVPYCSRIGIELAIKDIKEGLVD